MSNTSSPATLTRSSSSPPSNPSTAHTPRVNGRFCTPQQGWGEDKEQESEEEEEFFDILEEPDETQTLAEDSDDSRTVVGTQKKKKKKSELGCAPGNSFLEKYHAVVKLTAERPLAEDGNDNDESYSSEDETLTIDEEVKQRQIIARREKWERGKAVAAKTFEIFRAWGAEELKQELNMLKGLAALGPHETTRKAVLLMRDSVTQNLRRNYRVYVQNHSERNVREEGGALRTRRARTPVKTAKTGYGQKCLHPACGRMFESGEYKVSFEPRVWTQPVTDPSNQDLEIPNTPRPKKSDELFLNENFDPLKEIVLLAVPDYQKLSKDVNVEKYGEGKVFCVRCFEDLLIPENEQTVVTAMLPPALQSRANKGGRAATKRKAPPAVKEQFGWLRPSPVRRIYSVIFPETRFDLNGIVELDEDARETVEDWKQMLRGEGERKLREKYPFLGPPEEDSEEEDIPMFLKQPGIGLAECLWEVRSTAKRSKTY